MWVSFSRFSPEDMEFDFNFFFCWRKQGKERKYKNVSKFLKDIKSIQNNFVNSLKFKNRSFLHAYCIHHN